MLCRGTEAVALGRRAVALLRVLIEQAGVPVTKEALVDAAWPGLAIEDSNLTVQISALRRALGAVPGGERWIETLPRRGYRFVGPAVTRDEGHATAERQPDAPAPSPPRLPIPSQRLEGDFPIADLDTEPIAESRFVSAEDGVRPPLARCAEGDVIGLASRGGIADPIRLAERRAPWKLKLKGAGWLPLAPGPSASRYLPATMLLLSTVVLLAAIGASVPRGQQTPVAASVRATATGLPLPTNWLDIPVTILPFAISLGVPPPGLGERVANDLAAHLPLSATVRVVPSQVSSDPTPDFKTIGAKLGVDYIITGTVSAQDEKVRVGVALVDTRHGRQVWELHATEDRDRWPAVHEEFIHRATFAIHFQAVRRAGNEPVDPDKEPTVRQLLARGNAGLLDASESPRFEEAKAAFTEVLRREPESVAAMVGLAYYYIQSVGDLRIEREPHLTQAEEFLRHALAMRTHYHTVHHHLALLHNIRGNLTAALEELDRVIELYPSHAPSYARKGRILIRLQRYEEALRNIRYGMRINGGTIVPGWQLWLGWAELELGHDEEALQAFNRALGILPRNPYVHASLAAVYALKGERDATRRHVMEMRKRTPQLSDGERQIELNKGPDNGALRNRLGEGLRLSIEIADSPPSDH
jgi:DNA-binding winged helix-turn-helix (wHTH) protein/tetratricopeptide (TPR) repeat protein